MPNSIELAKKYQPIIDEIYATESKTAVLDSPTIDMSGANEIKILKISTQGLGTYSGSYPKGTITSTWETLKLLQKRSRRFDIDRADNEESLDMLVAGTVGQFTRTQVVPELDAIRFAKYADKAGKKVEDELSSSTFKSAVDSALTYMVNKGVPESEIMIFINAFKRDDFYKGITRTLANETVANMKVNLYNNLNPIIEVPSNRFYSALTLLDGATSGQEEGGYIKNASTGKNINFMLVAKSAVWQAVKWTENKMFTPDQNQESSGYIYDFLAYHDAGAYDNKVDGIYVHKDPDGLSS